MADWERFKHGQVSQIGDRAYAYTQVGGWGFNNMMLVVSGGETLLVDVTTDRPMTEKMLSAFQAAEPAATRIDVLALTHWHLDHVHGACLPIFQDSRVVCAEAVEDYMANVPPAAWLGAVQSLRGDARRQMDRLLGDHFDFSGLEPIVPTENFNGRTAFKFGDQPVELVEAKPCHTASDTVVHLPGLGLAHLGDITSAGAHQSLQYPGLGNVIAILEEVMSWGTETFVAGHGPVMYRDDIADILDYDHWLMGEGRRRFDGGMTHKEAADDLLDNLGKYRTRRSPLNVYLTMKMLFAEFAGNPNDHARRNYPKYLATALHNGEEFPKRHPDLVAATEVRP